MKKFFTLAAGLLLVACSQYVGVPEQYHASLNRAIEKADTNRTQIVKALADTPQEMREGMAFLISYMPERDVKTLSAEFLVENVKLAYEARQQFEWSRAIPDSVFFNDVLPYVCLNETRENWRADFMKRFTPYVKDCKTITEAIDSINKNIRDELLVDYNTLRERPDQSPSESIRQHMASCSGLSILLTDAFRAVGIPSRIAGTASWHDERGNHNWCEVWVDGQWYFTEYYPNKLNDSWFLADAGKADASNKKYAIYASSFKPTDDTFPLVWDMAIDYVPACNVTQMYVDLYNAKMNSVEGAGKYVKMRVMMLAQGADKASSEGRVAANVDVFCGAEQIGGGRTAGATQDLNDVLEFLVEKNKTYTLKYADADGKSQQKEVVVKDELIEVVL